MIGNGGERLQLDGIKASPFTTPNTFSISPKVTDTDMGIILLTGVILLIVGPRLGFQLFYM